MRDDFGIRVGAKDMASTGQIVSQLEVVVDFAVERDPQPAIASRHGLPASRRQIDDAQSIVAERRRAADVFERAERVRPPMVLDADHRIKHGALRSASEDSRNPAHRSINT